MSKTVRSHGHFAVLANPIEDPSDTNASLYEQGLHLRVTNDGCLVFSDWSLGNRQDDDIYGLQLGGGPAAAEDMHRMIDELDTAGLLICTDAFVPYSCIRYTGSDNPVYWVEAEEVTGKSDKQPRIDEPTQLDVSDPRLRIVALDQAVKLICSGSSWDGSSTKAITDIATHFADFLIDKPTAATTTYAWKDYPEHPVEDWRAEIEQDTTRLGYLDWIKARIEKAANRS